MRFLHGWIRGKKWVLSALASARLFILSLTTSTQENSGNANRVGVF